MLYNVLVSNDETKKTSANKRGKGEKNMLHDYRLTMVQVKTLDALINHDIGLIKDKATISACAERVIAYAIANYPAIFTTSDTPLYYAYACAKVAAKAIKLKTINVFDYIALLAQEKADGEQNAQGIYKDGDFGAFGDLYEVLVKCALVKNINLIKSRQLTVRELDDFDVISKKYGKIEIGHNGKTFNQGSAIDFLSGDYKALIYGVFDDETKAQVYNACMQGDIKTAIAIIKAYSAIFADKYDFYKLQSLRRGKIITIKSGKIMVQYNAQFYKMFIAALENDFIVSLETI